MDLKVKDFVAQNGERFSQLYDANEGGFPLFYPTAYVSRALRSGQSHGTQKEALRAIKNLYEWADREQLDLHHALITCVFLKAYEIASLAFYLKQNRGKGSARSISEIRYNSKLSVIAKYLHWYANEIITNANRYDVSYSIDKMRDSILERQIRKTGSDSRRKQELLGKKLSSQNEQALLRLFNNPAAGVDVKAHIAPRRRNVLALRILYDTGMRLGELLGLQLQDFIPSAGGDSAYLVVRRNHDNVSDDRVDQPVVKTHGRRIAIGKKLEKDIKHYLLLRAEVPHVGFRDDDFLLVNHLAGPRQGMAITKSSFRSALIVLKQHIPALHGIHPHLLRHDWNYRFSIEAKERGYSEEEERSMREELMGWSDGSDMSKLYNRRHIQEKAAAVSVEIADDTARRAAETEIGDDA